MRKIKEKEIRVENWCGYDIRFINVRGSWYAVLKDLCDALNLKTKHITERLDPDMLEKVAIPASNIPSKYNRSDTGLNDLRSNNGSNGVRCDHPSKVDRSRGDNKARQMLVVNEEGIYETLFASRKLEARKFRRWTFKTLKRLRSDVGLKGWEVLKMTDREIQDEIDFILDSLYWDPEKKCVMQSVTVQGGDVEQRFYSR